jgi:hypothetical protein
MSTAPYAYTFIDDIVQNVLLSLDRGQGYKAFKQGC